MVFKLTTERKEFLASDEIPARVGIEANLPILCSTDIFTSKDGLLLVHGVMMCLTDSSHLLVMVKKEKNTIVGKVTSDVLIN